MTSLSVTAAVLMLGCVGQVSTPQSDVRVAIVAYEDFHGELEQFRQLFGDLAERDPTFHFQLAVGTYSEVLHWMDRRLVDLAVLTPGVFASGLSTDGSAPSAYRYLTTIQLPPATSAWASQQRQAAGFHDHYRSVCLVAEDSKLTSIDDLIAAAREDRVEFLFVHAKSVSGRIAPTEALRRAKIQPSEEQIRFTYSHSQSIRMLSDATSEKERVAFVWDDAAGNDRSLESGVRRLSFPELDELIIPHDVIVGRVDFEHVERLQSLLVDGFESDRYRGAFIEDWESQFRTVRRWLDTAGAVSTLDDGEEASLEDISQLLLQYARSQPQPPRLAVVLSGGGAKCSYQVGAIAALEERLAKLRRENPEEGLDIALVVGTSGGAINALPVAMGVSSTKEGDQVFRDTWTALDQRQIVRPSLLIRANMGLWFALVQTAIVVWIVRRFVPEVDKRGRSFAVLFTGLAAIEILIGYFMGPPWWWLGTNHIWHHLWLWFSFGVRTSAWSLFAIGVGALALEAVRARRGRHINIPTWLTKTTLLVGGLGLPLLQVITVLTFEQTLSGGHGMERALAEKFPRLIDRHLSHEKLPPLDMKNVSNRGDRLKAASRQVIERGMLRRDLVITGSCLEQTSQELPPDLYFYAPAQRSSELPPFGARGLSLIDRPQILLDVVMGSGSIFPVFPPRQIDDIPRAGERIELVDGGFAHNSPVEAAVLWGATHIVLIEATPRTRSERGNFVRNATSSFRHLHQQAQLLDARSRDKVLIFSLSPDPPHMCVLDFADNLIKASIRRGYRDASSTSRFRKELGEPIFSSAR